ncbi:MAG: hypothetical protein JXA06_11575 [Bacteroidetes bacterium]|nr:hypothetical protein [Bacteroidota bacterium]
MPNKPKLNPEALNFLHKRLNKPTSTIRSDISRLKRKFPNATLNAVAQIYAQQHKVSILSMISKADKLTIPSVKIESVHTLKSMHVAKKTKMEIIHLETSDHFLKKHIDEINKAYSAACFTSVFVLTRKVLENLIIGILKVKYPNNRELYFDKARGRYQDFSVVLDNLYKKRNDFDPDPKSAVERLHQKLKPFKNDANDKVHSLFHIVESSKEVDDWNINTIIALIAKIS